MDRDTNKNKHEDRASSTARNIRNTTPLALVCALFALFALFLVARPASTTSGANQNGPRPASAQALSVPLAASEVATQPPMQTAGEGTATSPAYSTYPPSVTTTTTPDYSTPNATAIAVTRVAYATSVGTHLNDLRTSVALTHAPTDVPGPPSPVASPTPMLGILPGCSNTNAYEPQAVSCWRGVVNGQLVDVDAGRLGRSGDMAQGIVRVHTQGQENVDIYNTPSRVGAVQITSVNGSLFTLSTVEAGTPQIFVFDLSTRQWVSP